MSEGPKFSTIRFVLKLSASATIMLSLVSGCHQVAEDFGDSFGRNVVVGEEAENDQTYPLVKMIVWPPDIESPMFESATDDLRSEEEVILPTERRRLYSYFDLVNMRIEAEHSEGIMELGLDVKATFACYSRIADVDIIGERLCFRAVGYCVSRGSTIWDCAEEYGCHQPRNFINIWNNNFSTTLVQSDGNSAFTRPWALVPVAADARYLGSVGGADETGIFVTVPTEEGFRCHPSRNLFVSSVVSVRAKATSFANRVSITPWFSSRFLVLREDLYEQ